MTQIGSDPWALFFRGLGNVAVPAFGAALVAGLIKISNRHKKFLNAWLVAFIIAVAVFAYLSFEVAQFERSRADEPLPDDLIQTMKTSHAETCRIAIADQSEREGLEMTEAQIGRHCECVGNAYFRSFSRADFKVFQDTLQLPPHLMARREDIQMQCFLESISE